ncbi:MAG TPA: VOC family protein [Vicinamibacterales bacterium]|nr:VOC family protein [Vicinamibacterales bacterium]
MVCLALSAAPAQDRQAAAGLHLDHTPIVVRDLAVAAAEFRAFGFTIKPGRPHTDGIENASIKFADGSYLELITSHDGSDAVSREYQDFLKRQEGAKYVFLRDEAKAGVSEQAIQAGGRRSTSGAFEFTELPSSWQAPRLQLIRYLAPSGDSAATYQHANTARRLVAIWMLVDGRATPLARALGARPGGLASWTFGDRDADAVPLADGTCLMLVPRRGDDPPLSTALGVLVEVESLERLAPAVRAAAATRGPVDWLGPSRARGVWLGFVARPAWGAGRCGR